MKHLRSFAARSLCAGRRSKFCDHSNEASHTSFESFLRSTSRGMHLVITLSIALFAELNRYWPSVGEGNSWYDRMRSIPGTGHYSSVAYNKHSKRASSSFQYGGCVTTV